jgi:uncharacterized protein (TIGR03435 family)
MVHMDTLRAQLAGLQFEVASARRIQLTPEESLAQFRQFQRLSAATHRTPLPSSAAPVISGLRVDMDGIVMKDLIARAYEVDPARIATVESALGPRISQIKFVIHATMPPGATKAQLPEMLRVLLQERFHLAAKLSLVEQPLYALVVVKTGKKFGEAHNIDRSACAEWRNDPAFSGAEMCVTERRAGSQ